MSKVNLVLKIILCLFTSQSFAWKLPLNSGQEQTYKKAVCEYAVKNPNHSRSTCNLPVLADEVSNCLKTIKVALFPIAGQSHNYVLNINFQKDYNQRSRQYVNEVTCDAQIVCDDSGRRCQINGFYAGE